MPKLKRIKILTDSEIDELYSLPICSQQEREEYFAISDNIQQELKGMKNKIELKIYFILMVGYFRQKPAIPVFELIDVKQDAKYVAKTYFPGLKFTYRTIPKSTRAKLVTKMLSILGFKKFDKLVHEPYLLARLKDITTISNNPIYIFDECLAFFSQRYIALTAYTTLQDYITQVLTAERQRTEQLLSKYMTDLSRQRIKNMINTKGLMKGFSNNNGSARDFTPAELDSELDTHTRIKKIYPEIKKLVKKLNISNGNLNYYASIIKKQSTYKIRRYPELQRLLYMVSYLYFRFKESNDKLVTAFCYLITKLKEQAKAYSIQQVADELEVIQGKMKQAGQVLNLFIDDSIDNAELFGKIRDKAFDILSLENIQIICNHMENNDFDSKAYEWKFFEKKAGKTQNIPRKLFLALDFECENGQTAFEKQISVAKQELVKHKKLLSADQRLISKADMDYIVEQGNVNFKRYEFFLYRQLSHLINNCKVYIIDSESNKRLEDDLIAKNDWNKNYKSYIKKTGLSRLITPIQNTLSDLTGQLDTKLGILTQEINNDANEFVKRHHKTNQLVWSVANKSAKDDIEHTVFDQLPKIGIIELMNFVDQDTNFLNEFKKLATKKHSVKANKEDLLACIFGNGTHQGLANIASNSDRSSSSLRSVDDDYIRIENTALANELISNGINKLPICKYYTINEEAPFGSIDGQKFECRIKTFKARFSSKYFRKGKGISAMSLVSNHVALNTKAIPPNEYEGHHVFDLLYNNESDIQPTSLATDTHGVNKVNFSILDIFGYQFTPRYAKFKHTFLDEFEIVFGNDIEIKLKSPINVKRIEQEWKNIQWIMCSLSRKTATQSTIVKKLSNNKNNNRILLALHEYNRLIKCIYLLEYVNSQELRQHVQQALNRGEAYHQLRKAIASVNGASQFRGGKDADIDEWNDCARIIANCVVYFNSAVLSIFAQRAEESDDQKTLEILARISPVAWSHIQLSGEYTFSDKQFLIDLFKLTKDIELVSEDEDDVQVA